MQRTRGYRPRATTAAPGRQIWRRKYNQVIIGGRAHPLADFTQTKNIKI